MARSLVSEALERHSFHRIQHVDQPPMWIRGRRHGRRFTAWLDDGTLTITERRPRLTTRPARSGELPDAVGLPLATIDRFIHGVLTA